MLCLWPMLLFYGLLLPRQFLLLTVLHILCVIRNLQLPHASLHLRRTLLLLLSLLLLLGILHLRRILQLRYVSLRLFRKLHLHHFSLYLRRALPLCPMLLFLLAMLPLHLFLLLPPLHILHRPCNLQLLHVSLR